MNTPLTNAKVKLTGTDGNVFAILGKVSAAIRKSDHPELVQEFLAKAKSGNYDNAIRVCYEYVEVS